MFANSVESINHAPHDKAKDVLHAGEFQKTWRYAGGKFKGSVYTWDVEM